MSTFGKGGGFKMIGDITFLSLLSKRISSELYSRPEFTDEITSAENRKEAIEVYKKYLTDKENLNWMTEISKKIARQLYNTERYYDFLNSKSEISTIKYLAKIIPNIIFKECQTSKYILNIENNINLLFKNKANLKLNFHHIESLGSSVFTIKNGKKIKFTKELFEEFKKKNLPLKIVHDKDGNIGVIGTKILNKIELDNGEMIYEGYKCLEKGKNKGRVFHNIYLCDSEYMCLESIVFREGKLKISNIDSWYQGYVNSLKIDSKEDLARIEEDRLYFSFMISSGTQLFSTLQTLNLEFEGYSPQDRFSSSISYWKRFKHGVKGLIKINPDRFKTKEMRQKSKALFGVIYQFGGPFTQKEIYKGDETSLPKLFVPQKFFNLFSSSDKFSIQKFKDIFKNFENKGENIEKLVRFIRHPNGKYGKTDLKKSEFYQNWLDVIKRDLHDEESGNKYFEEFSILAHSDFTENFEEKSNHYLIKKIDEALINLFGYSGYLFLLMGVMSVGHNEDNEITVDFLLFNHEKKIALLKDYAINPLLRTFKSDYGEYGLARKPATEFFTSLFVSGYYHAFYNSRSEPIDRIDIFPNSRPFLDKYFIEYSPSKVGHYQDVVDIIFNNDLKKYYRPKFMDVYNTIARRKVYSLLCKFLNLKIENMGLDEYTEKQTKKLSKLFLRQYVYFPSSVYDFIIDLRDAYNKDQDAYIKVQTKLRDFSNSIIERGFVLKIPYEDLERLVPDIYLTFSFYFLHESREGKILEHSIESDNYRLIFDATSSIEQGEIIKDKLSRTFKKLKEMLTHNFVKKYFEKEGQSPKFQIHLYREVGSGLTTTTKISNMDYYKEHIIDLEYTVDEEGNINPEGEKSLYRAIGTLLFYLLYEPHSIYVVKADDSTRWGRPLFYGDLTHLITPEYIDNTFDKKKDKVGTTSFPWKEGDPKLPFLPREIYDDFVDEFEDKERFFAAEDLAYWKVFQPARDAENPNEPIFDVIRRFLYRHLTPELKNDDGFAIFPIEGDINSFIEDFRN